MCIRDSYGLAVYLEPGEAVALNAGYLVTEVCDIVHNGMDILILDASAACHMPVSYTHLDVYKRQIFASVTSTLFRPSNS